MTYCGYKNPCAYCLEIFKNCEHENTIEYNSTVDQCIFCDKLIPKESERRKKNE